MLANKKIGFIGGGAMCEALIGGLLGKGLLKPEQVTVNDVVPERLRFLNERYDVKALLDAFEEAESVKGHPSVILARTVKGKCISFAENNAAFHNGLLTAEQCKTAMCDLDAIRKGRE